MQLLIIIEQFNANNKQLAEEVTEAIADITGEAANIEAVQVSSKNQKTHEEQVRKNFQGNLLYQENLG